MISRKEAFHVMDRVLRLVGKKGQAEVILTSEEGALTRFANNQVTQNVSSRNLHLSLRVQRKGRIGRASTRLTDNRALATLVERAQEGLSDQVPKEKLLSLVGRQRYKEVVVETHLKDVRTPESRERAVRAIVQTARKQHLEAAGIVSFDNGLIALANSQGMQCSHRIASGRVSMTITGRGGSGWSDVSGPRISLSDIKGFAQHAAKQCIASRNAKKLAPGPYTVILEPACVGDLLQFMAWYGFGAQAYQEGQSFLAGKMGKRIFSKEFSIEDNVFHPKALGFPFDFEGVPRRRVSLIQEGKACGVVHDRRTALRARIRSTGHGLPEPNEMGPIPLNLVVKEGKASLKEMIASTQKGLWITHFHYTNVMDSKRLTLTGLTRDGVFLIKNGKVSHPVQNFRFTESLLNAFSKIEVVGRDQVYTEGFFGGGFVVPALKIRDFQFTSLAEAENIS